MKLRFQFSSPSRRATTFLPERGFTLVEILIALTIFIFVIAGILAANLYGLRMFQTNQTKLNVSAWSRNTFGKITGEIQSCNALLVGSITNVIVVGGTNANFVGLLDGEAQQGNALLIYPNTDTNSYILYYTVPSDPPPNQTFQRIMVSNNVVTTASILAYSITNAIVFSAQNLNLSGNVFQISTNSQNNRVIHLKLEMYQPPGFMQDPDYYKLETSVTRRAVQ